MEVFDGPHELLTRAVQMPSMLPFCNAAARQQTGDARFQQGQKYRPRTHLRHRRPAKQKRQAIAACRCHTL